MPLGGTLGRWGSKNYFFMNMVVWHNQNDEDDTSHVSNYQRILHTCEELVRILRTSEIINVRNLSILNVMNVRPRNLTKLTIRKFHIWQM